MRFPNAIRPYGTRANQPEASALNQGNYYTVTDEDFIVEQSDGSAWVLVSDGGGGGGGTADRLSNPTLAVVSSLANGDAWVEASGASPSRTIELKVRDGGVTYTIAAITV